MINFVDGELDDEDTVTSSYENDIQDKFDHPTTSKENTPESLGKHNVDKGKQLVVVFFYFQHSDKSTFLRGRVKEMCFTMRC